MYHELLPPHDIDAEEAVLGSLLIDQEAMPSVSAFLEPDAFYREIGQWVYRACLSLFQRGDAINQITVAQELARRERLELIGGTAYLSHLIAITPTSLHAEHYAQIVHRLFVMRQLIAAGNQITSIGYHSDSSADEAIDQARVILDSMKPAKSKRLEMGNLRILKSKPPHYLLNVNGADLSLSLGELQQWGRFRTRILSELDFIPIKPKNWDATVNALLESAQKMEAPIDASAEVEVRLSVKHWFEQRGQGEEYSDIQAGCYAAVLYRGKETGWEQCEVWAFQPTPLLRWLKRDLGRAVTRDSLWAIMSGWGAVKHQWRIGKNTSVPVRLWAVRPDFAEAVEFAIEGKQEEMELPKEEVSEGLPDI